MPVYEQPTLKTIIIHLLHLFPEYNISAAAIGVFSLAFIILGTLCILGSLRKGKDYLHKPAGMFYAFAGKTTSASHI